MQQILMPHVVNAKLSSVLCWFS